MFIKLITLLTVGFSLGLEHAFDPDHVVAVSTIVSETKSLKQSAWFGILWGLGHTTTLFLVGGALLLFKWSIPERLAIFFEFGIGVLLIFLGGRLLYQLLRRKEGGHIHEHQHEDGVVHLHLHEHQESDLHRHRHRSFGIGLLHGLAGSAALGLLVVSSVPTVGEGILFILLFGIGSICGMLVTTTLIALPFKMATKVPQMDRWVKSVSGVMSVLIGIGIVYGTGLLLWG